MFQLIETRNNHLLLESHDLEHVKAQYDLLVKLQKLIHDKEYEFKIIITF